MATFALNRRARADYRLLETFEAGIKLTGPEVKSVRQGGLKLEGSYVTLMGGQLKLVNALISAYKPAGPQLEYDPTRTRELLVHRHELDKIIGRKSEAGLTLVPTKAYSSHNRVKVEVALAKGRREFEKREHIKKREDQRSMRRALRGRKS
jgi:SsrA-binding protein